MDLKTHESDSEPLLDLPLREAAPGQPREIPARETASAGALPLHTPQTDLFAPEPSRVLPEPRLDRPVAVSTERRASNAPLRARLRSGLVDLGAHAVVLAVLMLGTRILGARLSGAGPALAVVLLVFSFLYTVPGLVITGRTPGAAAAGLWVHAHQGGTPSALQATRRWLAQWMTWLVAGLPALLRLADRWSGTHTQLGPGEPDDAP